MPRSVRFSDVCKLSGDRVSRYLRGVATCYEKIEEGVPCRFLARGEINGSGEQRTSIMNKRQKGLRQSHKATGSDGLQ
jgi:hypothetical protein